MESLNRFIKRAQRRTFPANAYVLEPGWNHLYVRYGPRAALGRIYSPVLDLANLEVEAASRGKGIFTRLITRLREEHPELHLFVENTHERFGRYLLKLGFVDVTDTSYQHVQRSYLLEAREKNS
jgi:hypothetical protein